MVIPGVDSMGRRRREWPRGAADGPPWAMELRGQLLEGREWNELPGQAGACKTSGT